MEERPVNIFLDLRFYSVSCDWYDLSLQDYMAIIWMWKMTNNSINSWVFWQNNEFLSNFQAGGKSRLLNRLEIEMIAAHHRERVKGDNNQILTMTQFIT